MKTCHWCGRITRIDVPESHPDRKTIDHVKCKAECSNKKEWGERSNKVIACFRCNQKRNNDFLAKLKPGQNAKAPWDRTMFKNLAKRIRCAQRETGITKTGEVGNYCLERWS